MNFRKLFSADIENILVGYIPLASKCHFWPTGKPGEPPKMKDEKELKPVSMRVRDAAESLLMLILEQVSHDTDLFSSCSLFFLQVIYYLEGVYQLSLCIYMYFMLSEKGLPGLCLSCLLSEVF